MKTIIPANVWTADDTSDLNRADSTVVVLQTCIIGSPSLHAKIVYDDAEDEDDRIYEWQAVMGDDFAVAGERHTAQAAADAVADAVADYFMTADSSAVLRFVRHHFNQTEIAKVLGVDQGTISRWQNDEAVMARATRTFIAYMAGVRVEPGSGKWVIVS